MGAARRERRPPPTPRGPPLPSCVHGVSELLASRRPRSARRRTPADGARRALSPVSGPRVPATQPRRRRARRARGRRRGTRSRLKAPGTQTSSGLRPPIRRRQRHRALNESTTYTPTPLMRRRLDGGRPAQANIRRAGISWSCPKSPSSRPRSPIPESTSIRSNGRVRSTSRSTRACRGVPWAGPPAQGPMGSRHALSPPEAETNGPEVFAHSLTRTYTTSVSLLACTDTPRQRSPWSHTPPSAQLDAPYASSSPPAASLPAAVRRERASHAGERAAAQHASIVADIPA